MKGGVVMLCSQIKLSHGEIQQKADNADDPYDYAPLDQRGEIDGACKTCSIRILRKIEQGVEQFYLKQVVLHQ